MNALQGLFMALAKDMDERAAKVEVLSDKELDEVQFLGMSALAHFKPICTAAERVLGASSKERDNRIQRGPAQQLEYFQTRTHDHLKAEKERRERITCVLCGIHGVSLDETAGGSFSLSVNYHGSKAELNPGWNTEIPLLCRACAKKMPAPWNRLLAMPEEAAGFTGMTKA